MSDENSAQDRFDLQKVHDHFVAAIKEPADVYIDTYLEGYKELFKYIITNRLRRDFTLEQARIDRIHNSQIFPIDGHRVRLCGQRFEVENRPAGRAASEARRRELRHI